MEGVLVSAKRACSTMTITVVSNAQGQYSFPRDRLEAGTYFLSIRAIGYELPARGPVQVGVGGQQTATLDLHLVKTKNLAHQLSNGEWLQSFPGAEARKEALYRYVFPATRWNALPILSMMHPRWPSGSAHGHMGSGQHARATPNRNSAEASARRGRRR